MLRFFNLYFPARTVMLLAVDVVLAMAAVLTAAVVRVGPDSAMIDALVFRSSWVRFLLAPFLCVLCLYYCDLYEPEVLSNRQQIFGRLTQAVGAAAIIAGLVFYVAPDLRLGRGVFMIWLILVSAALWGWRAIFARFTRSDRLAQRVVLLGRNGLTEELTSLIGTRPDIGLRLSATVEFTDRATGRRWETGEISRLAGAIQGTGARRVIVTDLHGGGLDVTTAYELKRSGLILENGEALFEAVTGRARPDSEGLASLVFADEHVRMWLAVQRVATLVASAAAVLLMSPLMLVIAAIIKFESRGPAIFRQFRVGKDGKPFVLYKFRTMIDRRKDTEAPASKEDDRFTRVGRWLRRTRLDELPQLFNILRGDMNFVGPRPFAAKQEEDLARAIPGYMLRWAVKPGITGWAQVCRGYCETLDDNIEKLSYDLYYIKHHSIAFDSYIVFKTLKILLLSRGSR